MKHWDYPCISGLCACIFFAFLFSIGTASAVPTPTPTATANFGDIPRSLSMPAGKSVRRNAANTAFENYTPSTGGIGGSIADQQVAFGDGTNIAGDSRFRWVKEDGVEAHGLYSTDIWFRSVNTFNFINMDDGGINISSDDGGGGVIIYSLDSFGVQIGKSSGANRGTFTVTCPTAFQQDLSVANILDESHITALSANDRVLYDPTNGAQIDWSTQGVVLVHSVLALSPLATSPGSLTEGMIYEDSSVHHFYGYNGTIFKQLDNDTPTPTPTATPSATATATATATPDVSDVAYDATSWDGVTTFAPSKNAVRDKFETKTGSGNLVYDTSPTLTGSPLAPTQASSDNSTKLATTAYVTTGISNAVAGVNPAVAVQAATTAAGDTSGFVYNNGVSGIGATLTGPTANVAVTIDGYTFTALGQRLLVKNDTQSPSGAFNGVYYVTTLQAIAIKPVLTRALDYDMPSDINNTGAIPVVNGTVNTNTSWLLTSSVATVGTDPLTYVQFSIAPASLVQTTRTLTIGGTAQDLSADRTWLGNVTNDAQTKAAIVPNTAPAAGQILVGNAGGTAYAPVTVSGVNATITAASTGAFTIATATDSVPGVMSAADHTKLTGVTTATSTGVAPAFVAVGLPVVGFVSGVDFKTNATTDIFTVPASRAFVVDKAEIIPRSVSGGAAIAIVWSIIESGASTLMTANTAATSAAPVTTKVWFQAGTVRAASTGPTNTCAAGNKVQFSMATAWTTSTSVSGDVFVFGHYSQ